jgi:hypothetical protein
MSGQRHAKVALPAWQSTGSNCIWGRVGTGAVSNGYGEEINLVHPPGFEHHTVQLVGSRYTDKAIIFV